MKILACEINGEKGYKVGSKGVCYTGTEAYQEAMRELSRLQAAEFEKNPAPLTETREEKEEREAKIRAEGDKELQEAREAFFKKEREERLKIQEEQEKERIEKEEKEKQKNKEVQIETEQN